MSGTILGFPFSGVVVGGNGSIAAEPGDGSIENGNARGANAVDWQQVRGSAANVASGPQSVVGGGLSNTASGAQSTASGGWDNVASGIISWVPGGRAATTRGIFGRGAWAGGRIGVVGDAQCGEHPLIRQTTDATATRLTVNNAAAGTTNTINLPNFAAYSGTLTVVSKATGSTDAATWRINVSAVRGNGAATTALYEGAGTAIAPTASSGTGSAWRLDVEADTTNGGIAVTVTGAAATTINHSARFANVEVVTAS